MLTFKEVFIKELRSESEGTRKMLALVPMDMATWKPHNKSMPIRDLAIHIADIPSWITLALTTDVLDFADSPYNPRVCTTNEELLSFFDTNVNQALKDLEAMNEDNLNQEWVLRNGEEIYVKASRLETIRLSFCQVVHHRAQLGVYLRLLDIPIPGMYGPSADELGL